MRTLVPSAFPLLAPVVCLLGGESSGKSSVALTLQQSLIQNHGLSVARVDEHLRTWCERTGRSPQIHEQAAIAQEQTRQIAVASADPAIQLVIADTSALTVAAYSELYFGDQCLWPMALEVQKSYAANLLMGLDLPWIADTWFRDSATARTAIDSILRHALQAAKMPFKTVYGRGDQRLHNALRALNPLLLKLGCVVDVTDPALTEGRNGWICDACSDPGCEHRLFTRLLP